MRLPALGRRLSLKFALAGILQFVGAGCIITLLAWALGAPFGQFSSNIARFHSERLSEAAKSPGQLEREIERLWRFFGMSTVITDANGALVARTEEPKELTGLETRGHEVTVPFGEGGKARFTMPPPPSANRHRWLAIGATLFVIALVSLVLSRSLVRPIRRIRGAAQAFGDGDLTARSNLARGDELGELAHSFDEMADRLASLIQSQKTLLANVSHELRTPLARIRVALDLAEEGDAEEARSSLKEIGGDLAELERLISDVLVTARLELAQGKAGAGELPLRRERFEVAELLKRLAAQSGTRVQLELKEPLPMLSADPVLLRRAVANLLENALQHSGTLEPVLLSAAMEKKREKAQLVIEVVDQGEGIAAEELSKLMVPFARGDKSRARTTGGLGLGLALSKRIVEAHGGTLTLASELAKGTTCRIVLPLAND